MKIKLLSDLHLEFSVKVKEQPYFAYDGEDVLILAGDIDSGASNTIRTLKQFHAEGYKDIVYVPGNHEYYSSGSIVDFNDKLGEFARENPWLHFLNRDVYIDHKNECIFIGATLWTFFNDNDLSMLSAATFIQDFRRIKNFSPARCAERYQMEKSYIQQALSIMSASYPKYKIYIVTHFMPARVCISEYFRHNDTAGLNDYFANNLDDWLYDGVPEGLTWCFGHTHTPCDIQHGNTRLVCNAYGYHGHEVTDQFNPKCYV